MPEIPDVLAGADVLAVWGNQIRDRVNMRYISQAQLETSEPTPQAGALRWTDDNGLLLWDGAAWQHVRSAGDAPLFTGLNRGIDPGLLNLGEAQDWTDFPTDLDLGSAAVGVAVTVTAVGNASSLNVNGTAPTYRMRVGISLDGGTTFDTGSESYGSTNPTDRRQFMGAQNSFQGVPTGSVVVKLEGQSAVGELRFDDGYLTASVMPTAGVPS